ncbi:hypothetical protein PM026_16325 [Halorubrum ezzemoulense]|jgi:hypothetical protein|uniref:hypothetical protein n=1 Tax=Halorubrum ezzemoulense TaxID=337243 RepID=UPI002009E387|nr:hypothetical protein [Halorubrum ezzemoulense]MDB2239328.1 hypothetical protein [Halorubrum ezzemoulense]
MRELEVNSRLRTADDADMESLAVHVMPECRRLVVVHPGDRRPFDWVGRDAIVKLNEEAWDALLVLVEPDREQAVAAASWDVLGDVVAGRE